MASMTNMILSAIIITIFFVSFLYMVSSDRTGNNIGLVLFVIGVISTVVAVVSDERRYVKKRSKWEREEIRQTESHIVQQKQCGNGKQIYF